MKRWLLLVLLLCSSADSWASDTFKFTHYIFLTCWSNKYLSKYINGVQYMLVHLSQSECLYVMTSCTEVGSSSVTVRCCYVDARCFFLLRITGTRLWTFLCELWCVVCSRLCCPATLVCAARLWVFQKSESTSCIYDTKGLFSLQPVHIWAVKTDLDPKLRCYRFLSHIWVYAGAFNPSAFGVNRLCSGSVQCVSGFPQSVKEAHTETQSEPRWCSNRSTQQNRSICCWNVTQVK